VLGTIIYNHQLGTFTNKQGPIFANLLLADEINRAPAKVQSALLEAMAERSVTIGDTTYPLPHPFLVLATQNPIEQEGTYNLPEAQLDRFMFKIKVDYPSPTEELEIMARMGSGPEAPKPEAQKVIGPEEIDAVRKTGAKVLALAALIDRSGGDAKFDVPFVPLARIKVASWEADKLPKHLTGTPAVKPGSRGLA